MKKSIMGVLTLLWVSMIILGWKAINGSIDMEVINAALSTDTSLLDGVTMEVTECSYTSVTVRIVNDTDKDIQCGEDFCLEMQDEETGEWRELDEVIDNAAFTSEAYMIQKYSPYEKIINFEWLYGKLEPGRYRIIKTVTDFRGSGDYTDYVLTAEFSIKELTMEVLLELYESDGLTLKVEEEGLEGFLAYGNMKPVSGMEDSLTGLYICGLVYPHTSGDGITSDRNYELQLSYWRPEMAEEYGHTGNEIDNIRLMEKGSKDAVLLYEAGEQFTPTKDLRGFLQRDYGMDQYLVCDLPDGFTLGEYREDIGFCGGWLLEGEAEEPPHDEWISETWYCPGGIGRGENAYRILQFDSGTLTNAALMMNHTEQLGETEILEGCEVQAVLVEYAFDLFTAAGREDYLSQHPGAEEVLKSHYWYVFMGKEDSGIFYVLFLNEEHFTKDDVIRMARSVRFTERAF